MWVVAGHPMAFRQALELRCHARRDVAGEAGRARPSVAEWASAAQGYSLPAPCGVVRSLMCVICGTKACAFNRAQLPARSGQVGARSIACAAAVPSSAVIVDQPAFKPVRVRRRPASARAAMWSWRSRTREPRLRTCGERSGRPPVTCQPRSGFRLQRTKPRCRHPVSPSRNLLPRPPDKVCLCSLLQTFDGSSPAGPTTWQHEPFALHYTNIDET